MIEQTELVVSKWLYHPPSNMVEDDGRKLTSSVTLEVMKKTAPTKKGLACRFTIQFVFDNETILEYSGEDSYVIDLDDVIDRKELRTMIRNSYSKFKEKFDVRKLGTVLKNKTLLPLDETKYDLDPVLLLLQ
jgi:hypothetical protein